MDHFLKSDSPSTYLTIGSICKAERPKTIVRINRTRHSPTHAQIFQHFQSESSTKISLLISKNIFSICDLIFRFSLLLCFCICENRSQYTLCYKCFYFRKITLSQELRWIFHKSSVTDTPWLKRWQKNAPYIQS